jgi:Domain of unknown function (DUF3597)
MSVFGNIISAIFGKSSDAKTTTTAAAGGSTAPGAPSTPGKLGTAAKPLTMEEVRVMIAKIADEQDEDYNWKESIVDLMKLLKLDSSLNARKQLAQELGYTGALNGSAEMNIWLHKQVMTKVAESGGVVPDSLKHA